MNGGPSESIEVEGLLATSVLDSDNIPNQNQSETCFSCGSDMVGLYCKDCGQKNDDLRRSIFFLGIEAFTSIFSVESRMWRTWLSLFKRPGLAAREFADGKRTLWTSPVRIYLAMSIILFGYMSLTDTRLMSVRTDLTPKQGVTGSVEDLSDIQIRLDPKMLFFVRQKTLDKLNENVDFERVEKLIAGIPRAKFTLPDDKTLTDALNKLSEISEETGSTENNGNAGENDKELAPPEFILLEIDTQDDLADTIINEIDAAVNEAKGENSSTTETTLTAEEQAFKQHKSAISKLNTLLSYYPNMQEIASELATGELALTPDTFLQNLPDGYTVEKKAELEVDISDTLSELKKAGISQTELSEIDLELYERGALFFNQLTINNKELNSGQIQRLAMTVLQQPEVLNEAFAKYLPRIMFFMMPFAMFAGIIFIRGKKTALMYDHLVHAAYIHAFAYLLLLTLIILSQWTGLSGLSKIFIWGMIFYLPISAKFMFKRGWFKTLLMSYSIGFQYTVLMFFIMLGLLIGQLNKTIWVV